MAGAPEARISYVTGKSGSGLVACCGWIKETARSEQSRGVHCMRVISACNEYITCRYRRTARAVILGDRIELLLHMRLYRL